MRARRTSALVGAACALMASVPATASAEHGERPDTPFYSRSMTIAYYYWNDTRSYADAGTGACGPFEPGHTGPGPGMRPHLAWADLLDGTPASSERGGCRIYLDRDWFPAAARDHWRCELIVHEYGHLLGHEDSADPASVMHPVRAGGKVPACYEFGPAPVWPVSPTPPAKPRPRQNRKRALRRCRARYHRPAARRRCMRRALRRTR